jgi:hypothetical protein|tara:strand:- start:1032 stop:1259 length:228 start_codon:yes stop_codon:yes gene_type:complete
MNLINKNNMSKLTEQKIIDKVVDETVDTIIDNIDEVLVDYMYEYGNYEESDNKFLDEKEEIFSSVITELYNRINK